MEQNDENIGLSTKEALLRLCNDIEQTLRQFEVTSKNHRNSKSWIKDAVNHTSEHTTINWIWIALQLWIIISIVIVFCLEHSLWYILEIFILSFLLIVNLVTELHDNKLRYEEIPKRVQQIIEKIRRESNIIEWSSENYPNLYTPTSPCITLQWTYRDKKLINLPWPLLVKDDIIVIRPGHISPGYCEAVDKNSDQSSTTLLHAKEVYAPIFNNRNELFSGPRSRKPLESKKFKLLETPYLSHLKIYLEQALDRPITSINQQRHLIMTKIIQRILTPIIFIIVFTVNLLKYFYFSNNDFIHLFLIAPQLTIMPLLPLLFPMIWNCFNYMGLAKFYACFDLALKSDLAKDVTLDGEDTETTTMTHTELRLNWSKVWRNFLIILKGDPEFLSRSSNILHVFGSVTALGCVDKKGILSWPNPTAEKVFFLHNNEISPVSSLGNVNDIDGDASVGGGGGGNIGTNIGGDNNVNNNTPIHHHSYDTPTAAIAEVLDLTHNHSDPFKLHFDDHDWHRYLTSLKPLGLTILLNTCNVETQQPYSEFYSHITCEAIYNENLIPVINRRCLCELAKEIGFVDEAQKIFGLEQQLSTYRHLQPEMVRKDNKYARSLQLSSKLKFPFPHMFAVIVKELSSGSMQLLSEGTADIILDSCVDYWDGHDLCPLTPSDRKKIQDFYQRSSLTAYCTAFAYRPLNKSVANKMGNVYLELPSDSRHLYMNYTSPTQLHWDVSKNVLEPKIKAPLGQFYSTDSLLYNDCPSVDITDAESCFHIQCNQVFIGMVTMQYQPLTDMVQLIEQLERACIRFVHFSKENELRSRVFSEKMGLESGWNCHISLISERNRRDSGQEQPEHSINNQQQNVRDRHKRRLSQSTRKLTTYCIEKSDSNLESSRAMSFSAPSAINMEQSTVKFNPDLTYGADNKLSGYIGSSPSHDSFQINNELNMTSTSHEWQSLSCLTDSTEQSAPVNFDMSNRAKLPRGIDKIRPHIELIDNVPLLVSLFTDCTPNATKEMLNIMQDYGEIVCIMGSSANWENAGIFMQADASIAVQPLFPQLCQRIESYEEPQQSIPCPMDYCRDLNSVACSLSVKREDPIIFYVLIMEARHFLSSLWNCVQFWISCCVLLCLIHLTSNLFIIPEPLTIGQNLWLCCIVIPVLSISLIGLPVDPDVMRKPQGKNLIIVNLNNSMFILWCYGLKFLPTGVTIILVYLGILAEHCNDYCEIVGNCTCTLLYLPKNNYGIIGWGDDSWTLTVARLIILFLLLLHFVVISMEFVYREHTIFQRLPIRNYFWLYSVAALIVIQGLYSVSMVYNVTSNNVKKEQFRIPVGVIIFSSLSIILIFIITELVKRQEITVNKRFQKRARLDFGTKLGMNSPF